MWLWLRGVELLSSNHRVSGLIPDLCSLYVASGKILTMICVGADEWCMLQMRRWHLV